MGNPPSKFYEPLVAQTVPVWATESRFVVNREVTLKLREKFWSWSGDDYEIKEVGSEQLWFKVKGRAFSIRDKKVIHDFEGKSIINMREQLMSFFEHNHKIYRGEDDNEEMFKVTSKATFGKAKANVPITNQQNQQPLNIVLKGDVWSTTAVIYIGEPKQGGIPVAKIHRPINARDLFLDKQDYYLTIAPNVDTCLMVTLCIILDEMKKDNN